MTSTVVSADGTTIGFESVGSGPPLVMVHGGVADRTRWLPVATRLAEQYTVHLVDRRGRGLSTAEADQYDIRREGEDIAAVAAAVGPDVYLFGHSYGALCSLQAAMVTDAIARLGLYEPPMESPGLHVIEPAALAQLRTITDREALLEGFMRASLRRSQAEVDAMKGTPVWQARVAAVHTILRELDQVLEFRADERLAKIDIPVRMFLGTESPAYLKAATEAVAARIAGADIVPLHGQAHQAMDGDPDQFIAAVLAFGST
jgi:pimeloyl-ACP methyl ester carboxylesterase